MPANPTGIAHIQHALQPLLPLLEQAASNVQDQMISNYPVMLVFPATEEASIGLPLVDAGQAGWSVNITTLEELVTKGIVEMANVDRFREVYKSNKASLCCLLLDNVQPRFIFIPVSSTP
ncbi:MAG: hypothetical protein R2795_10045 [Saprospiraceae bacterium]